MFSEVITCWQVLVPRGSLPSFPHLELSYVTLLHVRKRCSEKQSARACSNSSKVFLLFCEFCAYVRALGFPKSKRMQVEIEFVINKSKTY